MGSCHSALETEQFIVQTLTEEEVHNGPFACMWIGCLKTGKVVPATVLNKKQYMYIDNAKDGNRTVIQGPGMIFLRPYERIFGGVREAIALKPDEYCKILNEKNGEIRVDRGEKLVFLDGFESLLNNKVEKMIVVDKTHACLIRDIKTGSQTLITEPQMFVPSPFQEIVASQDLIVLKEFEVLVLVDPQGKFVFKHGWIPQEASFFVPPYHTTLKHQWTKTSVRKALAEGAVLESILDEERFEKIDVRHRFMPYRFCS